MSSETITALHVAPPHKAQISTNAKSLKLLPRRKDPVRRPKTSARSESPRPTALRSCSYSSCQAQAEPGNTYCEYHLRCMRKRARERIDERISEELCVYCGTRPPFWGRRCVICRQLTASNPLPLQARTALNLYRNAEAMREAEQIRTNARIAGERLFASGVVQGKRGVALRLYIGLDDGQWRTYAEIGRLMNLSVERVRQLLLPSKITLSAELGGQVPWRSMEEEVQDDADAQVSELPALAKTCRHGIATQVSERKRYRYEESGLPNILLFGVPVFSCRACNGKFVKIPCVSDLHNVLVNSILLKPASLTGREFRFLRQAAALRPVTCADLIGVTEGSVKTWEASPVLRFPNDITARIVIGSLLAADHVAMIPKMLDFIRRGNAEFVEIGVRWVQTERHWRLVDDLEFRSRRAPR